MLGFLFLALSGALLAGGAELFAEHAAAAGRRLGVSALAVGLVLAGAEPEEMATAIFAASRHHPGLAAGDAIGANITMLAGVLGLAALARPLYFAPRVKSYALVASGAGVAAATLLTLGRLGPVGGGALVLIYVVAVSLVWWRERRPPAFGEGAELLEGEGEAKPRPRPGHWSTRAAAKRAPRPGARSVLLMVAGIVGMAVGGGLAVAGAEDVVRALGLRDSVVGLTFVALATTAELLALVWAAARRGIGELALAGVLGSATYNATATLGVAALIGAVPSTGVRGQAWLAAALPAALAGSAARSNRVGRLGGVLLLGVYGGFLAFTFSGH